MKASRMRPKLAATLLLGFVACQSGEPFPETAPADQRLWCGEKLCEWTVLEGQAGRSPGWHERDPGVRLSGTRAALSRRSQLEAPAGDGPPLCLWYQVHAKLGSGTSLQLQVDIGDDGSFEITEQLKHGLNSASSFFEIGPPWGPRRLPPVPAAGSPARLTLLKQGAADVDLFPQYVAFAPCPSRLIDAGIQ